MNETYSHHFVKSLRKFSSIKERIPNKIDKILQDPLMGEPLKYDLRGIFCVPVAKNVIVHRKVAEGAEGYLFFAFLSNALNNFRFLL